ncbi:unnamed protein product, partial [Ectocarpus sp. 12 AP-2014]
VTVTEAVVANAAPVIAENQEFSIAEDAAPGAVVGTVAATDAEEDVLSYAITAGDDAGIFAIGSENGEVTLVGTLDFETVQSYVLTIEVSDATAQTSADVTVNVTDVIEQTP